MIQFLYVCFYNTPIMAFHKVIFDSGITLRCSNLVNKAICHPIFKLIIIV